MYSLEERTKAVQLYIESGCSENIVIRTLGYPSYGALSINANIKVIRNSVKRS